MDVIFALNSYLKRAHYNLKILMALSADLYLPPGIRPIDSKARKNILKTLSTQLVVIGQNYVKFKISSLENRFHSFLYIDISWDQLILHWDAKQLSFVGRIIYDLI